MRALQKAGFDMNMLRIMAKSHDGEEDIVGCYTIGESMRHWRKVGALENGLSATVSDSGTVGVPTSSTREYEESIVAGKLLLVAHGGGDAVVKARDIIKTTMAAELDIYDNRGRRSFTSAMTS